MTVPLSPQLGRSMGPPQLQLLLDLLRDLVLHCIQLDAQKQQNCAATQTDADADLFLDLEAVALLEGPGDKVLSSPPPPIASPGPTAGCLSCRLLLAF